MKRLSVISAGTALVLVLAACASGESPDATEPTLTHEVSAEEEAQEEEEVETQAGDAAETATIDVGRQPAVGECWNNEEYEVDPEMGDPVECSDEHTQRTLAILDLPENYLNPHERARALDEQFSIDDRDSPEYDAAQLKVIEFNIPLNAPNGPYRQCEAAKNEAIGAVDPWQATFPYVPLLTYPNETQWDSGQRWVRCDIAKRKNLTSQSLVPLPKSLPTLAPISIESSVCRLKKRTVACSKLTEKQIDSGNWYLALTGLPKPAGSPIAQNADEASVLAEDTCIEQLRGKIDPRALENGFINTTLASNIATAQWIREGRPKSFTDRYWNANDATIDCEVPAWAVRQ